jgi:hypothetical protein
MGHKEGNSVAVRSSTGIAMTRRHEPRDLNLIDAQSLDKRRKESQIGPQNA